MLGKVKNFPGRSVGIFFYFKYNDFRFGEAFLGFAIIAFIDMHLINHSFKIARSEGQ